MRAPPITVSTSSPFLQIQHLFVILHISGAPVVDERGLVVGIVTTSDLLQLADEAADDEIDDMDRLDAITAADIATPAPVWVTPDTSIAQVAHLMLECGIHRVLVGRDGRLLGILTSFDLLQALDDGNA